MIEVLTGATAQQSFGGPKPAAQGSQPTAQAGANNQTTLAGGNAGSTAGIGAQDVAPDQAAQQNTGPQAPGPENDFGQRGSQINLFA